MKHWVVYAFASMGFAGLTAVIAKPGLAGISSDLGLAVRTCFVFVFVLMFAGMVVPVSELQALRWRHVWWLAASAATTAASWVFYYKAIQMGDVATVALIDKGSVIVAFLCAWLFLHEAVTPAKLAGMLLIVAGMLVIARG